MTNLVDQAITAIRNLPAATQDHIARFMLELAMAGNELAPDEAAAIEEAEAEIARGERVPPDVIDAFWKSRGL